MLLLNLVGTGRKQTDKPRKEQSAPSILDDKGAAAASAPVPDSVVVVGKGYGDESVETPPKNSLTSLKGSRDRRRTKGGKYAFSIHNFSALLIEVLRSQCSLLPTAHCICVLRISLRGRHDFSSLFA